MLLPQSPALFLLLGFLLPSFGPSHAFVHPMSPLALPLALINAEQWVLNATDLAPPIPEPLAFLPQQAGQGRGWAGLSARSPGSRPGSSCELPLPCTELTGARSHGPHCTTLHEDTRTWARAEMLSRTRSCALGQEALASLECGFPACYVWSRSSTHVYIKLEM